MKFDNGAFPEIISKAEKYYKSVFINAYTYWCDPCKLMVKNIFILQSVSEYYIQHFINVNINTEKGVGIELVEKYHINSYPTYLFINGKVSLFTEV
ncbi:thioredoxin [Chryseobacterium candidae]|uniref:Thioredoxin n=1 Tax=Chryseobacterium candidae TaxID=1978493 RepID=A0ABY2R7E9_9FLAO|nr:thioredoxin [Chryseobacterium candidae]